jgi:hypothetical protein
MLGLSSYKTLTMSALTPIPYFKNVLPNCVQAKESECHFHNSYSHTATFITTENRERAGIRKIILLRGSLCYVFKKKKKKL